MLTYAAGSSIRVGDAQYQLKQFHFHRPSEGRIHRKTYDMELHLVHADEAGHLAVVAVLLEHGKESPLDARPTQPLYGRVVRESR
jgi:carbonic anhydrase